MLKQYDRNSAEFRIVVRIGMLTGALQEAVVHASWGACQEAWKKSGEPGDMPLELSKVIDVNKCADSLVNGIVNHQNGIPAETVREEVKKEVNAIARKAVTEYLSKRVTA